MRKVLLSSIAIAMVAGPAMAAERTGYMAIAAGNLKKGGSDLVGGSAVG